MMRRALFRLAATLPLAGPHDGLARPVNAPPGTRPAPGVQPGTTSPVINAVRVIVGGPPSKAGVFVYSGAPGRNALIASETNATTDPFGNTAIPGTTNYTTQGGAYYALGLSQSGFFPRITWYVSSGDQAGAYSVMYGLYDASSAGVHGLSMQNIPYITPPGAWTSPLIPSDPAGANAGVAETWHSLGTLAGYTVNAGRYRLTVEGETEIDLNVTGAGANAASVTFSNTLPAPYRPTNAGITQPLATNATNAIAGAYNTLPRCGVTTAGAVSVVFIANVTGAVTGTFRVPTT